MRLSNVQPPLELETALTTFIVDPQCFLRLRLYRCWLGLLIKDVDLTQTQEIPDVLVGTIAIPPLTNHIACSNFGTACS